MPDVALVHSCTLEDCASAIGASARARIASQRRVITNPPGAAGIIVQLGAATSAHPFFGRFVWPSAFFTPLPALHYVSSGSFLHVHRSYQSCTDDGLTRTRGDLPRSRRRIQSARRS